MQKYTFIYIHIYKEGTVSEDQHNEYPNMQISGEAAVKELLVSAVIE